VYLFSKFFILFPNEAFNGAPQNLSEVIGSNKVDDVRPCSMSDEQINLLKPTGHVMHHQFNIQQLCILPTLYLCVLYLCENKQRLVPLTA
jgi:hypothetical protein